MNIRFRIRIVLGTSVVVLSLLVVWIPYMMLHQNLLIIDKVNYNHENRKCLALNVYFEARNQLTKGQIAVANVTLNRVYDKRFPKTICDVVKQGKYYGNSPRRDKCQFSFWCDGQPNKPKNITA